MLLEVPGGEARAREFLLFAEGLAEEAFDDDPTLPPSSPNLEVLGGDPRSPEAIRQARYRARRKRKQANGVPATSNARHCGPDQRHAEASRTVTRDVTRDVTCDVTRDASRGRGDPSSLSFSRFSKGMGGGDARAGAPVTRNARDVTRDAGQPSSEQEGTPPPRDLKSIETGELPPPPNMAPEQLRAWATDRLLDPDHERFAKFLDVRRAYPRRIHDWPGAWRIFLDDELTKYAPRARAAPAAAPAADPSTGIHARQKERDAGYRALKKAAVPAPVGALLAALGGKKKT